ncbi:putative replication factor C subunit 1 [Plasmodium gaboni]|uniref:Replication factor C subunit 1 n=1 Tax=Plasmodium gaboni TaxID=647221 RepID=A0A151LWQ1_9APIC|nr:putative replication factor C subunit 1 [Plasmodium gaboni]KYO03625.1 putative replication factor C subunit 1 [Plasmodium gaboni]
MSSTGKKLFSDDESDGGRKKKRLKKLSSSLFHDDDDDDFISNNKMEKSKSQKKSDAIYIDDNNNNNNNNNNYSNNNKSSNRKSLENKSSKTSNKFYDITSFFKPSSKKLEDNNTVKKSNGKEDEKRVVNNLNDYFNILQNDNKVTKEDAKSNNVSPKNEINKSNIKREREQYEISSESDTIKSKKSVLISPGKKQKTEHNNNNEDLQKFDYLPFHNQKFVITGVFKNFTRDELQSKIKEHGGSVMSAVSTKTNYLVHGEYLEDGRLFNEGRKYTKAFELQQQQKSNIKILNEEELLKLLPQTDQTQSNDNIHVSDTIKTESKNTYNIEKKDTYNNQKKDTHNAEKEIPNQLWVEKYRPKNINELVGNNQNVIKLQNWLASWEDVCIKGIKKQAQKTFRGIFENVNARCALLSGPAGIGKTTTAKIVSEASGYNVIEFNASDERNKAAVEKISEMATGGYSIMSLNNRKLTKTCIIMDEVDGMSSGDKGGSTAILKLIEKTKCPIICICNDRQNNKMRTLANKCYDLKFSMPQKNSVVKRLLEICKKEGIMMEPNALELLWESTCGDIRQMLNTLQLLSKTYTRIQFLDLKKELNNSNKNIQSLANPFEITLKLLNFNESSKLNIREIMDLFFVDYELIPYFISENYTNVFNDTDKSSASLNKWNVFSQIAHDLSLADKIKYNMKSNMDFALLPHFAILSCVCPVMRIKILKSFMSGRVNFPTAFGKISTFNKNKRLLNELCFNLSYKLNVCPKYMVTSGFLNYIYFKIMTPLHKSDVNEAIKIMEEYSITREMVTENLPCLRLPNQENLYDKLDTKLKSSFTRLYNSSHVIKVDPNSIKKGLKSTEKKTTFKLNEFESDEDMDELSESKEDKDDDVLIKTKIDRKGTLKTKPSTKVKPMKKAK